MTITVIGHCCIDIYHPPEHLGSEPPHEQFGGIYYAIVTLANMMGENDTISPVFGVGEADYDRLIERLQRYPNVDVKGIFRMTKPTNRVKLFYRENGESRIECSVDIAPPIPFSRIKPYLDTDGILVNMVSGMDITLETLDLIRMEVRERGTPVHFDFHSLTLGVDEHATRFRRPVTDWRRWCFYLNSIQMSEEEAAGLTAERYDEPTLINQLMPLMVHALAITRGARGLTLITQHNKKLTRHQVEGVTAGATGTPTGCGDVFGAAFLYQYIVSHDFVKAAQFANDVAAMNATMEHPDQLDMLRERMNAREQTQG
jgi:sugar/nucleoside kinase (ribokinase family)